MNQDNIYIELLTDRFFEGCTSEEEDQILYAFFSNADVPEHLQRFKPVFAYFETGIKKDLAKKETDTRENYVCRQTFLHSNKIKLFIIGIAASLFLAIGLGIFSGHDEYGALYEGSYIVRNGVKIIDPAIVQPEIEKTLLTVWIQQIKYELLLMENILNDNQNFNIDDVWEFSDSEL